LCVAIVAACAGCDWQMFGYAPDHANFNPTEHAISVSNVAALVRRYPATNTKGCGRDEEYIPVPCSSPAVANGSIYLGTSSGDLVVRDADTGNLQWSAELGAEISSPSVVDGVLYFTTELGLYAFDAAGKINCSGNPKTCAPLWTG